MCWKLALLAFVATTLIVVIIPTRTHAVLVDPANPPQSTRWTLWSFVSNMYLTPGTVAVICPTLAITAYAAFRIIRSN